MRVRRGRIEGTTSPDGEQHLPSESRFATQKGGNSGVFSASHPRAWIMPAFTSGKRQADEVWREPQRLDVQLPDREGGSTLIREGARLTETGPRRNQS